MKVEELITLYEYNYWANDRLLAQAEKVPAEQLAAPVDLNHSIPFRTFLHLLDVEWSWRLMSQGESAVEMLWEVEPLPDIRAVKRFWQAERGRMLDYLHTLQDEELGREVTVDSGQGQSRTYTLWHILIHIINHGTFHRSELAGYLTSLGLSPGNLDFLDYTASLGE